MRRKFKKMIFNKMKSGDLDFVLSTLKSYFSTSASILRLRPLSGPLLGILSPTYRCNLRCSMCNFWRIKYKKEITTEEIFDVIDDLNKMKTRVISFSGGEPLLRKDIFNIIEYAKKKKFVVHMATNATLISEKIAKKLYDVGVDYFSISVDGATGKVHDKIRGLEGSFDRTLSGITNISKFFRDRETSIDVVSLVTEQNFKDIPKIVQLLRKLGINSIGLIPLHRLNKYKEKDLNDSKRLKTIDSIIDEIISIKKQDSIIDNSIEYLEEIKRHFKNISPDTPCSAGTTTCVVDAFGDVFPCYGYYEMRRKIGNIKDITLKELWFSNKYNNLRKSLFNCRKCIWNCHFEFNLVFKRFLMIRKFLNRLKNESVID